MAVMSVSHPISLKPSNHLLLNNNNSVFYSSYSGNISLFSPRVGFFGRNSTSYNIRISAFSGGGEIPPSGNNSGGSGGDENGENGYRWEWVWAKVPNDDSVKCYRRPKNAEEIYRWVWAKLPKDFRVKRYRRPKTFAAAFDNYCNKFIYLDVITKGNVIMQTPK